MSKNVKKIAYVSGGRMDFGLMLPVLKEIEKSQKLKLQVYYTGLHLMEDFGLTETIVRHNFPSAKRLNAVFESDSKISMAKFSAKCLTEVVVAFNKDKPDITLTLGDRAEMLCVAIGSVYLGIPTAQIHAGDKTFHVDEIVRHSITKLSHLFFCVTKDSADRVKKLGEEEWRINIVGAPGIDAIVKAKLPDLKTVANFLKIKAGQKFILVLQHPVSSQYLQSAKEMKQIISAVKKFNLPVVVVYPNADAGGREMIKVINQERNNPLFRIFPNIERELFLAIVKYCSVWITNSSAGRIESASLHTPVINVGIRQVGRPHGINVINIEHKRESIIKAVNKCLFDKKIIKLIKKSKNLWGEGKTSEKITKILEDINIDDKLLNKQIVY